MTTITSLAKRILALGELVEKAGKVGRDGDGDGVLNEYQRAARGMLGPTPRNAATSTSARHDHEEVRNHGKAAQMEVASEMDRLDAEDAAYEAAASHAPGDKPRGEGRVYTHLNTRSLTAMHKVAKDRGMACADGMGKELASRG